MTRMIALGCVWLLAVSASGCGPEAAVPSAPAPQAADPAVSSAGLALGSVTIGIHRVGVEIAESAESQRQGLSDRDGLPTGKGMLFVYSAPTRPQFWMKDMRFDIDIVWIADGRIVDLTHDVPHRVSPPLPLYQPRVASDHVLEVPAGTAARLGWGVGDPVSIER